MDLSIIIVNYNVKHFLEQCLVSVFEATRRLEAEVIVVDNNSVDGSQKMLREKFGEQITLIENHDNPGFSKANNQGIEIAKGRYVLLLNPDTVVEETTFDTCLAFMDERPKAGALGVKMIDGQGNFLPESKRAMPTPWVSFYKIFGLAAIFPKSKRFGKYHLSYLDKEENHAIEILSGAFMFMRKTALDEIGYLDEDFFMYGEDIDLSYRFIAADYQNYYLADTQIIHYKGESTKKGSLNYVRVFYQAMIIFARKHFGGSKQRLFIAAIRLAVYLRAFAAVFSRLIKRFGFPILEAGMVYGLMYGIMAYWEHYIKYIEGGTYPTELVSVYMPIYTLVFIAFLWMAGAYKKPFRLRPLILAPFWAFVAIATGTYMFSFVKNFSRAILGLSAVFTMITTIANRGLINFRERGSFFFTETSQQKVLLVGGGEDLQRIINLIKGEIDYPVEVIGAVVSDGKKLTALDLEELGRMEQIREIVRMYDVDEIVFDNTSLPTTQILDLMTELRDTEVAYKIVPPQADYIVGPQAIHTSRFGQPAHFRLNGAEARRQKEIFDLISGAVLVLSFPLLFFLYKKPVAAFQKLTQVFFRKYHMVGYIEAERLDLPRLKPGLLTMLDRMGSNPAEMNPRGLDKFYARTYHWELDLDILLKGWRNIH
ncbi:MAG: glycosyltransferase [Bacteroidota bacterium]